MGAGHSVTALYEIVPAGAAPTGAGGDSTRCATRAGARAAGGAATSCSS